MRKYLLPIMLLAFWSCEEEVVEDEFISPIEVTLWGEVYSVAETDSLLLSDDNLEGSIPSEIGNLTNLTYLSLEMNQLTGSIPPEIGNLTNLTYLGLDGNQLSGSIPPEIGNLTNLTYLGLSYNQFTGSIPSEILGMTNLTGLNLGDNQLTGEIPSEIGNLTNLTYLGLDGNQLSGSIPSEIWNLTNLTFLRLDDNQLSGAIPSEIGNLLNLELLYLSNNQLQGQIPETICDLELNWNGAYSGISNFLIYDNQLCPTYPSCFRQLTAGQQNTTNCEDCAGVPGGDALVDSCGVCDSDSTNNCAEDCAGVWGGDNICGCTDASASNFDSDATFDDGTCFICEVEMEVLMDFPFSSQLQEYINAAILGESYEFSSDWKTNCEAYFIFYQELFDNNCFQDDPYITQESIDDMVSEICTLND